MIACNPMSNTNNFQQYKPRQIIVVQLRPDLPRASGYINPNPMHFMHQTGPNFPFHTSLPSRDHCSDANRNFNQTPAPARTSFSPARDNNFYGINSQYQAPPPVPPRLYRPVERPTYNPTGSQYQNEAYLTAMPPSRINVPVSTDITPSSDFEGLRETTIIGSPPKTAEHKMRDISSWLDEQVVHLPPDILNFICSRIDNMPATGTTRNWFDLANRANFPLDMLYANDHTSKLFEVWRPKLSVLLIKLNEMDCKELVSEIIEKLKHHPRIIFPYQSTAPNYTLNPLNPRTISPPNYTLNSQTTSQPNYTLNSQTTSPPNNCDYFNPSKVHKYPETRSPSPSPTHTRSISPEEEEVKPEIFVSFHKNDEYYGREIIRQIELLNIPVTSNLHLVPGTNELTEITQNIETCRKVIGVISPDYLEDEMPLFEGMMGIRKSITGKKRAFIPIQVKPTEKLPGYFSSIKAIEWQNEYKWESLKLALKKR